jgi:hypothetical protein
MEGKVDEGKDTVSVQRNHFAGETWVPIYVPLEPLTGQKEWTIIAVVPLELTPGNEASMVETGPTVAGPTDSTASAGGTGSDGDISGMWTGSWTYESTGQETPITITFAKDASGSWTAEWAGDPAGAVPAVYANGTLQVESRGMIFEGTLVDENTLEGWGKTTSLLPDPDLTWRITRQ